MFDLDAYLERIGLSGRPSLAEVHRAHVVAIAFENLDPQRGVPISLAAQDVFDKLVTRRRGGYCFEQNTLLAAALTALGADVELLLGRVGPREGRETRGRSHLALRVRDGDGVWHADAGFGNGTLLEPVPFGAGGPHEQSGWQYRIESDGGQLVVCECDAEGEWIDSYSFAPEPVPFVDLETSNWFTCTHPQSKFTQGLVVTVHNEAGHHSTLSDWSGELRLREATPEGEAVTVVQRAELPALLAERFGLGGWALDERGRLVPAGEAQ